ncbi:delta-class carbonic anhydrase [uncultured Tateyamaria sp.]|uniref:delta-class carbonic anhydrase n=1 Tax=uncultured Tateyamaria sp. TaxID=455651 RepID=UPI00262E6904|nr:delta-class carbonic anhydrase [uncultured Tateyamaria sp.]
MMLTKPFFYALAITTFGTGATLAKDGAQVGDDVIAAQRAALAQSTDGEGFGPQAPRDLGTVEGANARVFGAAPAAGLMNLCNIHFHKNAEHKGGEFTTYAGNGNGKGINTGFRYDGELSEAELAPLGRDVGTGTYGNLAPGDTIEVHYVHTTAQVTPGPTLGACLDDSIGNPQLRVEAQVFVLVNDTEAADFVAFNAVEEVDGLYQASGRPTDTGKPIEYSGSTTGPSYNSVGSPFQVTWSVRPEVLKVSITSVETWLADNIFKEDHAHGVRNLVINPALISPIN